MKTLRNVFFHPARSAVTLYTAEGQYNAQQDVLLSSMPEPAQALAVNALAWLGSQMPEGFELLTLVQLTRRSDTPTAWTTPVDPEVAPEPTAWSAVFEIAATGLGPMGETTISLHSVPGEVTNATAQLWEGFITFINPS